VLGVFSQKLSGNP